MVEKYKLIPKNLRMERFYWLRTREELNLIIVEYVRTIDKETIVVLLENRKERIVRRKEMILFDPTSRLFKELMKNPSYRNDSYTKKVLVLMKFKPEEYMKITYNAVNVFDANIPDNVFYASYETFYQLDKDFCDESMKNIDKLIVNGTENMNLLMLYRIVSKNGGMEKVTEDQKWKSLFFSMMSKTNVSYTIRTFYKKYLYEYEFFRRYADDNDHIYNYVFEKGRKVFFKINEDDKYFGTIKLRRNKGINQYYVQFFSWSKENSEWFSEDILESYNDVFDHTNHMKRKTRSSKANNLIDDPLTREKHSHFCSKNLKIGVHKFKGNNFNLYENIENINSNIDKSSFNVNNTRPMEKDTVFIDQKLCGRFKGLMNNTANHETTNESEDNKIDKKLKKKGGKMVKKQEKIKNKRKIIAPTVKTQKVKNIEDFLINMGVMDKNCKLNGDNWAFVQFFGYK